MFFLSLRSYSRGTTNTTPLIPKIIFLILLNSVVSCLMTVYIKIENWCNGFVLKSKNNIF